ncbi:hypothetical protein AYO47_00100 [Planctomyces sp. SCGC AG-212-M04]|nr:hypothetical protein AYO47_00100 [Planctomyces sp. SCGC AG-212-M04]
MGKWTIVEADAVETSDLELQSNGIGYISFVSHWGGQYESIPFRWDVRHDRLTYGVPKSRGYGLLADCYVGIRSRIYGDRGFFTKEEVSFTILEVSDSKIGLRDDKNASQFTLQRIPE